MHAQLLPTLLGALCAVGAGAATLRGAADSCSLFEIKGDTCGQSDIDCKYAPFAKNIEKGLQDGTCASQGFTVQTTTTSSHYPVVGTVTITEYTKAAVDQLVLSELTPVDRDVSELTPDGADGAADAVSLVTFDGAKATAHTFTELNDPVMGGQSTGTWSVGGGFGVFDGDVVDVPSLKAPGFIKARTSGPFPDASSAIGGALVLRVRSSTPEYAGFRVTFAAGAFSPAFSCAAGGSILGSGGCYKAKFSVPAGEGWQTVRIPFDSFSDKWSSATGEQTTTCAADKSVCPSAKGLGKIQAIELWAEGVLGKAHLDVQSISAEPDAAAAAAGGAASALFAAPAPVPARPPAAYDKCSAAVQPALRFNISALTSSDLTAPVAVDPDESLATAICCDSRTKVFAEPQFLFQSPFVDLYAHMNTDGTPTTFYDSVCGLPLFHAPMNRTFAEFKADTDEHGWPSFRPAEIVRENVVTDKDGFVYSRCGTHLGSFLPDSKGDRWCLDLSCLAGNPQ